MISNHSMLTRTTDLIALGLPALSATKMFRLLVGLICLCTAVSGAGANDQATRSGMVREEAKPQSNAVSLNLPAPSPPTGDRIKPLIGDESVNAIIAHILDHAGLRANFIALESDVPNAMANIDKSGKRQILFNSEFINKLRHTAEPKWAQMAVLVHEIGHHLLGHIFEAGPDYKHRELEAEEFSGFLLYRLGATLEEAQLAASILSPEMESTTHPSRYDRLTAIARGWERAKVITIHEDSIAIERDRRNAFK